MNIWTTEDVRQACEDLNGPVEDNEFDLVAAYIVARYMNGNEFSIADEQHRSQAVTLYYFIKWSTGNDQIKYTF